MTNEQLMQRQMQWDSEMQERVFGARPMDDYNYKTRTFPKYTSDAPAARRLVEEINGSGRYRVHVARPGTDVAEWSVEVRSADGGERLSYVRGPAEAPAIVEAILTADVKL